MALPSPRHGLGNPLSKSKRQRGCGLLQSVLPGAQLESKRYLPYLHMRQSHDTFEPAEKKQINPRAAEGDALAFVPQVK